MALKVWGAGEWVPPQDLFFRLLQVFWNSQTRDGSMGDAVGQELSSPWHRMTLNSGPCCLHLLSAAVVAGL